MERNLTAAFDRLGSAILRVPEPQIDRNTDRLKLGSRLDSELNVATGLIALGVLGFLLIFGLGFLTQAAWGKPRLGGSAGLCVTLVGLLGYGLHYYRSRIINRRINELEAGKNLQDPLKEGFWSSSSDGDFIVLLAIGVIITLLANLSLK